MMNTENARLHHSISWGNTVPVIIDEKYKKGGSVVIKPEEKIAYPDEILVNITQEVIVNEKIHDEYPPDLIEETEEETEEQEEIYTGEYVVTFAYDLKRVDQWDLGGRFTGGKEQCETFIKEWQAQTTLF